MRKRRGGPGTRGRQTFRVFNDAEQLGAVGAVCGQEQWRNSDGTVHDDAEVGGGRQHKRPVADEQAWRVREKAGSRTAGHAGSSTTSMMPIWRGYQARRQNDQCGDVEHTGDAAAVGSPPTWDWRNQLVAAPHGVEGRQIHTGIPYGDEDAEKRAADDGEDRVGLADQQAEHQQHVGRAGMMPIWKCSLIRRGWH